MMKNHNKYIYIGEFWVQVVQKLIYFFSLLTLRINSAFFRKSYFNVDTRK